MRLWLACLLALWAAPATAATYYVSNSVGSDANSCATAQTISTPKLRISSGVACATTAGDTVYIRAGSYTDTADRIDSAVYTVASGSAGNVITIAGYPSETVTITPPDGLQAIRLTTGGPAYLVIADLILDGINQTLVPATNQPELVYLSTGAHHNRFLRLEVKRNSGNGFQLSDSGGSADFNEILDCIIHDNGRLNDTNTGYGIYLKTSDNLIRGNHIYSNNGYGIHHNPGASSASRNLILANKLHDNAVHGVDTGNGTTSHAISISKGDANLVINNLVYSNQGGIRAYTDSLATGIYNNTVYANTNEGISLQYYGSAPTVRNNIEYGNGTNYIDYDSGTGTPVHDFYLQTDPLFVNAGTGDFHLQSGSGARDTGTTVASVTNDYDGLARPENGVYDIGAFEYDVAPPALGPTRLRFR